MNQRLAASLILIVSLGAVIGATVTKPPVPKANPLKLLPRSASAVLSPQPTVIISWDYPVLELSSDLTFKVFVTTNIVTPNWTLLTNVVGSTQAVVPVDQGIHGYAVKVASTFWGIESPFSPVATAPPLPRSDVILTIQRAP